MACIKTDYFQQEKGFAEIIPDIERVIGGYVKAIGKENCSEAIKYDSREEIKYYLGEERKTAISWYPFKDNASVLEVGGEFGTITGELCDKATKVIVTESSLFRAQVISERYRERENLEVYVGEIENIKFPCQFDYIIIMNLLDKVGKHGIMDQTYVQAFSYLKKFLKSDGKFLLADENLYSIYKCQDANGALNPWTHIRNLHKRQIETIMEKVGFPFFRFYYPLPTYYLVGRVYSDDNLPTAVEWNCLMNYSCGDQNYLACNMDLIQKLTDNKMFPFFAPAFFIEAGRENNLSMLKKADVLFDEKFELPMLGFEWAEHGYSSFKEAIESYREKKIFPYMEKQNRAALLKIDQDYKVLSEVHKVELELLAKLQEVCDRHQLKLYGIYGTLLGAVRNAGMISGDDDIDVALMREDFNKLLMLKNEFEGKYFLQTPENDNCFFGGYLKLRNKDTSAIHPQNWWVDCCEGISIDIFPLDYGFVDVKKEKRKQNRIKILQRLLYAKAYGFFPRFKDMKLLEWKAYKYIGKLFSRKKLANKLNDILANGDVEKQAPFGIYTHYLGMGKPKWISRNAFEKSVRLKYEETLLNVPMGWDEVLKGLYGDDYLIPRPWVEGKWRHGFYNAEVPYSVYKKRFNGLFRPMPNPEKQIILFGDGYLFKEYFKKYSDERYKPKRIVSLYGENVRGSVQGIKIELLENLDLTNRESIYPIICSVDIRLAEEKMKQAGLNDYFIFLGKREWMLYANPTAILHEIEGSA